MAVLVFVRVDDVRMIKRGEVAAKVGNAPYAAGVQEASQIHFGAVHGTCRIHTTDG